MALASGANVGLAYVAEVTRGTTPASPTMKTLRATSRAVNLQKATLGSQEVRADRQKADLRHGFNQIAGSPGFELSVASYDDWLEAALSGTWTTAPTTGTVALAAVATGNKYTRSAGSFVTDGFMPGDVVDVAGFATADNNGRTQVVSVSATELAVTKTLVDEAEGADESIVGVGSRCKVGTTLRTFTIERRFTDVTQYQVFRGVAINQMSVNIQPDQIVGGSFDLIGMSGGAFSGTSLGVPTAAPTNSPFDPFTGVIYFNGINQAVVTGVSFSLQNGRSVNPVVGSKFSPDVFEGEAIIQGQMTAYFEDATLYDLFKDETEAAFFLKLNDTNGTDFQVIQMPRIKVNTGDIDPPQQGPVPIQFNFQALVDSVSGTSMAWQRSNA